MRASVESRSSFISEESKRDYTGIPTLYKQITENFYESDSSEERKSQPAFQNIPTIVVKDKPEETIDEKLRNEEKQ